MLSLFSTRTEHNVLALIYKHFSRGEVEVREPESPPCHVCQKERKEKKPSHDDSLLKCFFFHCFKRTEKNKRQKNKYLQLYQKVNIQKIHKEGSQ